MKRQFILPYHKGTLDLMVDENNLQAVLVPMENTDITQSEERIVLDALENPINSSLLRDLAVGKQKVTLITSDHTRAVPSHITLPILLKEIRQGNPEAEITILIATGLHREMTGKEMQDRFGQEICNREKIVVHNVNRTEDMVSIGILPSGSKCSINKLALEADLLVTEGFIEPHFFAGFSGGRKSILPGVASRETVNANHSARAIAHPLAKTGVLEGNPIHEDMIFAARKAGVDFILNVVLDVEKKIIGAVAGDMNDAHLKGCEMVSRISGVKKVKADIVVTSNGGYPLDQNLYQAPKCISTAFECVNPNGVIVVAAACSDGIGGTNFEKLLFKGSPHEVLDFLLAIPDEETISEQWCNQILSEILLQNRIILVSELEPTTVTRANMIPAANLHEAMSKAYEMVGKDASVTVIPDGVSVIAL